MSKRQITKDRQIIEWTTCSWCGVEGRYAGTWYVEEDNAMCHCTNCGEDFDIQNYSHGKE